MFHKARMRSQSARQHPATIARVKRYRIKAPCGAIIVKMLADEKIFQAYLKQLIQDHDYGGPGCPACKPENWTPPRTRRPPF